MTADTEKTGSAIADLLIKARWRVENNSLWIVADGVPFGPAHIIDVRGWGYLTGRGQALGLSGDIAIEVQRLVSEHAVEAHNAHASSKALIAKLTGALDECIAAMEENVPTVAMDNALRRAQAARGAKVLGKAGTR